MMTRYIVLFCCALFTISCDNSSNENDHVKEEVTVADTISCAPVDEITCAPEEEEPVSEENTDEILVEVQTADFICFSEMNEETGVPSTIVKLQLNDALHDIKTVIACSPYEKEAFSNYDVPDTALSAAGGWFAGGGDYFFTARDGNNVIVFAGWQDEGQTDEGFHYKKYMSFDLASGEIINFAEKE